MPIRRGQAVCMAAFDWVPIRQDTDPIGSDVRLAGGIVPAQRGDVGAEVIEAVRIALSSGRAAACVLAVVRDADQLARGRGGSMRISVTRS